MSLMSPALAGEFFTTSTTWEAQELLLPVTDVESQAAPGESVLCIPDPFRDQVKVVGPPFPSSSLLPREDPPVTWGLEPC